jgi:hypothetical protein
LLQAYGSLERVYQSLHELRLGDVRKLEAGRDAAARSAGLVRIVRDVPLQVGAGAGTVRAPAGTCCCCCCRRGPPLGWA